MESQFFLLAELQRLDDRVRAVAMEQQNLSQQVHPYEVACAQAQEVLVRLQTEIAETERQRRTLERELEGYQAALAKTQHKLREVKNNKEYSAVLAEIAQGKQRLEALEDRILELMELGEQRRQSQAAQQQRVQEAAHELVRQDRYIQQAQEKFARQMEGEQQKRQQIVTRLDVAHYQEYQRLAAQRDGRAVAEVIDGACIGCHLKIQPQLVSEIRRQERLFTCPHCRRMLLWPA